MKAKRISPKVWLTILAMIAVSIGWRLDSRALREENRRLREEASEIERRVDELQQAHQQGERLVFLPHLREIQ